jgi:4,5-DOPA dioxygenase extradiol
VTAVPNPKTIYDFYGFRGDLYEKRYPAPGSPELARLTQATVREAHVALDSAWGLDHGAWAVLCRMYPDADVPVVQLSLDEAQPPEAHYRLGRELSGLRRKGVLLLSSGNIVHNLREIAWEDLAYDWAVEFDTLVKDRVLAGDHQALVDYSALGRSARLAVPSLDHYLPLLYTLGAQDQGDPVSFFAEKVTMGSVSMRSVRVG